MMNLFLRLVKNFFYGFVIAIVLLLQVALMCLAAFWENTGKLPPGYFILICGICIAGSLGIAVLCVPLASKPTPRRNPYDF